jgi:hypothetical protein
MEIAEVDLRLDLSLDLRFFFSFGYTDFFVFMDGHPQATVVLFPCSLLTQSSKEATMNITGSACTFASSSSFSFISCSTESNKRGGCCIHRFQPSYGGLLGWSDTG